MRPQRHIIKRQVLELTVPGEQGAYRLQQQLSRIYSRRLVAIIDKCCSELSDPGVIHRIETLELDLGEIPLSALEEALSTTFEAEFRRKLAEAIRRQQSTAGAGREVKTVSQLELFGYFVQTGTLPWWADTAEAGLLDNSVAWLSAHAPGRFKALLADLVRHEPYRKRIFLHLADASFLTLARVLAGALAPFLAPVHEDLATVLPGTKGLKALPPHRLRRALSEAMLLGVGVPGAPSDRPGFVQFVLLHLAARHGIRYAELVGNVARVVQRLAKAGHRFQSTLPDLITAMLAEVATTTAPEPATERLPAETAEPDPSAEATPPETAEALAEPLPPSATEALPPEPAEVEPPAQPSPAVTAEAEPSAQPPPVETAEAEPPAQPPPVETAEAEPPAQPLPVETAEAEPPAQPLPVETAEAEPPVPPPPGVTAEAEPPVPPPPGVTAEADAPVDAPPGRAAEPASSVPSDKSAAREKGRVQLPEQRPRIDYPFSDADEWYVGNAGLVILWPFLSHFFEHLDLLEEKQFRDAATMHRAVGLLQHLADAQTEPPLEYLLPLCKVLCGMDLAEVFDFGPPITDAEIEECTALLEAVIGHASILGTMSVRGFQGTFLLRKGQLSTRDGVWLLRVERETYDVVLDRFPWSINIVKSPWMEAIMQVEW